MHDINLFSSPPLPPPLIHLISYNHTLTCQHFSPHTSISLQITHSYIHYHLSWNLLFYVSTFMFGLIAPQPSSCEHLTNYALSFSFFNLPTFPPHSSVCITPPLLFLPVAIYLGIRKRPSPGPPDAAGM